MEKGFNDEELADIMNEIESLEEEFSSSISTQPVEDQEESVHKDQTNDIDKQEQVTVEDDTKMGPHYEDESPEVEDINLKIEEEKVVEELTKMPVENLDVKGYEKFDDNLHHIKEELPMKESSSKGHAKSAMSFHVEGDMKLELSFHIGDQFVGVHITEDGLVVALDGGAKFTIPVESESSHKKAA